MSKITLPKIVDRFNQGCTFFQEAMEAVEDKNMPKYETDLRKSATETIGALEWGLKFYLRTICRGKITTGDQPQLKQPNFNDLMTLMNKYADPPLDTNIASQLYHYRDLFRNAGEHDASIPPSQELQVAIQTIQRILSTYLSIEGTKLKNLSISLTPEGLIQELKDEYFKILCERCKYIDFGGISPRVGSKIVKIPMEDVFIPLQATEKFPLFESFAKDDLENELETDLEDAEKFSDIEKPVEIEDIESLLPFRTIRGSHSSQDTIQMSELLKKQRVVVLGDPWLW